MSDNHRLDDPHGSEPLGEVNHVSWLAEHVGQLYLEPDYSDVVLVVEDVRLPAHKVILASCSEYFRALLYGGMRESKQKEVELVGAPLRAFQLLLKYIYSGQLNLSGLKEDAVLEVLELAHQYGFVELESGVSRYLERILGVRNVCRIYDRASLYQLETLACVCRTFVDRHALDILHSDTFYSLSPSVLKEMIGRDSFCAPEVDIFRAVCEWVRHNPGADSGPILDQVRLSLMSLRELLNVVRPTKLVCPDTILDAIASAHVESRVADLPYRGCLLPEENVATKEHKAQVLQGEMCSALLDGDSQGYDMERGFTRHPIEEGQSILVQLGMPCILNHMRLLLWDKDNRSYSYYIEVSMDQKDWVRVVDHSEFLCRSWQRLYFEQRVVRYVRIVGTHNTVNRVFHAVSLECLYTDRPFVLERGLVRPRENVATVARSAYVVEGVSRSRNALINGDTSNYDWDSGYTCHQLGSGAIVVQLAQPYLVDSMRQKCNKMWSCAGTTLHERTTCLGNEIRSGAHGPTTRWHVVPVAVVVCGSYEALLLWDCDSRSYSYYVEVSVNQKNWTVVADKRNELCRSWQLLKFPLQPVVFVKIVGMHNSANEVFHCVHFECPAQPASPDAVAPSVPKDRPPRDDGERRPDPGADGGGHDPAPRPCSRASPAHSKT